MHRFGGQKYSVNHVSLQQKHRSYFLTAVICFVSFLFVLFRLVCFHLFYYYIYLNENGPT